MIAQKQKLILLAFAVAFVAVASFHFRLVNGTWCITPDSTDYVEGARSLVNGEGYVDRKGEPITIYPPGTSIAYLPAAALPRNDYLFFNVSTKLMLLGFLTFSYLFLQKTQGTMAALLGFLVLSLSMVPLLESTRILSDIPFAFVVALILFVFHPDRLQNLSTRQAILLGFLITLSYFVRTEAIYVFFAYFFYILFGVKENKKRILVSLSCIFLCGVFLWWLRNAHYHEGVSYMVLLQKNPWVMDSGTASLADWQARISRNTTRMIAALGRTFSNEYETYWFGLSLTGLAATALLQRDRSSLFCFSFLLAYIPLHLTPRNFQDRYLISLLPILALLFLKAFRGMIHLFKEGRPRLLVSLALVLVLFVSPFWGRGYRFAKTLNERSKKAVDPHILFTGNPDYQQLILGYNQKLRDGDVIACFHANVVRYLTPQHIQLQSFLLSITADKSYLNLRNQKVTHLYVDLKSFGTPFMLGMLDKYRSQFELVDSNKAAAIYKTRFDDQ